MRDGEVGCARHVPLLLLSLAALSCCSLLLLSPAALSCCPLLLPSPSALAYCPLLLPCSLRCPAHFSPSSSRGVQLRPHRQRRRRGRRRRAPRLHCRRQRPVQAGSRADRAPDRLLRPVLGPRRWAWYAMPPALALSTARTAHRINLALTLPVAGTRCFA